MLIIWKRYEKCIDVLDTRKTVIKRYTRDNLPSDVFGYNPDRNMFYFEFYNIDSFGLILVDCTTSRYKFIVGNSLVLTSSIIPLSFSRKEFNKAIELLEKRRGTSVNIPCIQLKHNVYKLICNIDESTRCYVAKYKLTNGISLYDYNFQVFSVYWFLCHLNECCFRNNSSYSNYFYGVYCDKKSLDKLQKLGCAISDGNFGLNMVTFNYLTGSSKLFNFCKL